MSNRSQRAKLAKKKRLGNKKGHRRLAFENLEHRWLLATLTFAVPSVLETAGVAATTATLTRDSADDSQPLTATLVSSDTSELVVPPSVTILANSTSVTFPVDAVDDAILDGTQTVTVTATILGPGSVGYDTTFSGDGMVNLNGHGNGQFNWFDIELQADGKIITGLTHPTDSTKWRLFRFHPDGSPDTTFGNSGVADTTVGLGARPAGIELLPDGRIVVAGPGGPNEGFAVAQYLPNGQPDATCSE